MGGWQLIDGRKVLLCSLYHEGGGHQEFTTEPAYYRHLIREHPESAEAKVVPEKYAKAAAS